MSGMPNLLCRYRIVLGAFMVGLILSGITAFPLLTELRGLCALMGLSADATPQGHSGLAFWLLTVRNGLEATYAHYPWLAYGTDWLAFAHLILAVFFIGPLIDPVRNVWVLRAGVIACLLVFPLALICGPLRGIPFYWQLIDCSFGAVALVPLLYCLRLTGRMERGED